MPERTSYEPGTPSWVDLGTSDLDASRDFYGELFGWTADEAGPGSPPAPERPSTATCSTRSPAWRATSRPCSRC